MQFSFCFCGGGLLCWENSLISFTVRSINITFTIYNRTNYVFVWFTVSVLDREQIVVFFLLLVSIFIDKFALLTQTRYKIHYFSFWHVFLHLLTLKRNTKTWFDKKQTWVKLWLCLYFMKLACDTECDSGHNFLSTCRYLLNSILIY